MREYNDALKLMRKIAEKDEPLDLPEEGVDFTSFAFNIEEIRVLVQLVSQAHKQNPENVELTGLYEKLYPWIIGKES